MSALKTLLSSRPVAYYPELARAVGGIAPALFFQQIAHWQQHADSWVFRTQEQLEDELAMSPRVQATAREHLVKRGLLEERYDGMPRRLYYRPVWDNLESALKTCKTSGQDSAVGQVQSSPNAETTLKNSDESIEYASKEAAGEPPPDDFAGWQVEEYLRDELTRLDKDWTRAVVRRYTRQANSLYKRGADPEAIYEAADRVVTEWARVRLSLDDAMRDVQNGTQTNGVKPAEKQAPSGGTPAEVIDYVFANTRNDTIRLGEARIRNAMERFDFTSGEAPPYPIQKQLGGDDTETWAVLEGIKTLIKRQKKGAA